MVSLEIVKVDEKENILSLIRSFLGLKTNDSILDLGYLYKIRNDYWLVSQEMHKWINNPKNTLEKLSLQHIGVYLGTMRKVFALSMESLFFFKDNITRYILIKGKIAEKFLYGRSIRVNVQGKSESYLDFDRIVVIDKDMVPIGLSYIENIEQKEIDNFICTLRPIIDLGAYLRKEEQLFD